MELIKKRIEIKNEEIKNNLIGYYSNYINSLKNFLY
jgi:hypothetical protein